MVLIVSHLQTCITRKLKSAPIMECLETLEISCLWGVLKVCIPGFMFGGLVCGILGCWWCSGVWVYTHDLFFPVLPPPWSLSLRTSDPKLVLEVSGIEPQDEKFRRSVYIQWSSLCRAQPAPCPPPQVVHGTFAWPRHFLICAVPCRCSHVHAAYLVMLHYEPQDEAFEAPYER